MVDSNADQAEISVTPPVLFSGFIVAGFIIEILIGFPILPGFIAKGLAILLLIAIVVLVVSAYLTLKQAGTPINPRLSTTAVVTTGPFAYSRNPLYLALVALFVAIGLLINSLPFLLVAAAFAVALQRLVIEAEERYLEAKFGATYTDYKAKVKRWL
jgi:protein-S-isoprenylcysteine O-methyltransferase Ste14